MPEFTVTIDTAPGVAEAEGYLDRLIEVVYADDRFIAPALGLEQESGSVTFTFNLEAETWPAATDKATELVAEAIARVERGQVIRTALTGAVVAAALFLIARVVIERAQQDIAGDAPERERVPA